jgi:hypothetical protein
MSSLLRLSSCARSACRARRRSRICDTTTGTSIGADVRGCTGERRKYEHNASIAIDAV